MITILIKNHEIYLKVNSFVLELFDDEGAACTFYTVRWEGAGLSEADKFFKKFKDDVLLRRPLQELAKFLTVVIGDEYGALKPFFRFENMAQALPPSGGYQVGAVSIDFDRFPLRLYCLRLSDELVILFNGAEKTGRSAQEGKTGMAFAEANQFAARILKAICHREIWITDDGRSFNSEDGSNEILL